MTTALAVLDHWILAMIRLRNRGGLSADDAKRVFEDYHTRRRGGEDEEPSHTPEDQNRLMMRILDYMESTSAKLDKIEEDIGELRHQVDMIIKRL